MLIDRYKAIALHAGAYEALHAAASAAGLTIDDVVHAGLVAAGLLTPAAGAEPTEAALKAAAAVDQALPRFFGNVDRGVDWSMPAPRPQTRAEVALERKMAEIIADKRKAEQRAAEQRAAEKAAEERAAAERVARKKAEAAARAAKG